VVHLLAHRRVAHRVADRPVRRQSPVHQAQAPRLQVG